MKLILVLTTFLKISHGSYPLSPTNYNYYSNPAGNYNYNPEQKSQQYKSPSLNLSSNKLPPSFHANFLPSSTPSPSTYSNPSSGSFLPGLLPSRSSSTTTSSFGILPSSSPTSFSNNNFPGGPSINYYSTPPPPTSNNHQQWASTVPPAIPRWSTPQQSPSWRKIINQTQNNAVIAGGPPSANKFGSSASSTSHQYDEFIKAFIYSPTTTTTKPPTSSISFSTSLTGSGAVGEATRIRSTNIGDSSTFATDINTNDGINNSQETGQYWKSVSDGSNASKGGGGIVRGGPRGQQSIPSYTPSLSPQLYGGRPRGQIQSTETTQMWSTPVFSTTTNTIWGNDGPWKGLPQSPTQIASTKDLSQSGLQSTTESSYSSSSHSSSFSTKTEKPNKSESKASDEKGTPANSFTKNSFTDSNGVSASSPDFPSNLSKESLSLSLINPGNSESHKTPERSPRKYNQGKELLFYSDDISNDISEKTEENDSRGFAPKFEDVAKTGSFSWKGSDDKLYYIRYTVDDLGIHFENNDSPTISQSNSEASSVFSNLNLQQDPITVVISDDEYLNELQQEPLDSLKQQWSELLPHEEQDSLSSNAILVQQPASNSQFLSSIPTENETQLSNSYLIAESDGEITPDDFLESENDNNESKQIQVQSQPEIPEVVISFGTETSSRSPYFFPLNNAKGNKGQISSSPSASAPYSYYEYESINRDVKNSLLDSLTPSSSSSSAYQTEGQIKNAVRNRNKNRSNNKKISYAIRSKPRHNSAYYYSFPNSRSLQLQRQQHATLRQKYNSNNMRSSQMFSTIKASSVPSTTVGNMRGYNYNYNNYDRHNPRNNYKMNRKVYKG